MNNRKAFVIFNNEVSEVEVFEEVIEIKSLWMRAQSGGFQWRVNKEKLYETEEEALKDFHAMKGE